MFLTFERLTMKNYYNKMTGIIIVYVRIHVLSEHSTIDFTRENDRKLTE